MVSGRAFLVEYPSAARVVGSTGANSDQSVSVSSDRSLYRFGKHTRTGTYSVGFPGFWRARGEPAS